jgi:hypothetical protein
MVSTNHSQSHNLLQKIADKSEKNINPYFFERCTTVSQETKKQIEDLIFESDVLMESLREFFYSIPIQYDPSLCTGIFSVSDLPKLWDYDPDVKTDPLEDPVLHYRWFKLTQEQFLVQDELFRRYIAWASSARNLIEKFLPEKVVVFDEESQIIRKWIELSERLPSDDNANLFSRFRKHLISQQNIVSDLLEHIE